MHMQIFWHLLQLLIRCVGENSVFAICCNSKSGTPNWEYYVSTNCGYDYGSPRSGPCFGNLEDKLICHLLLRQSIDNPISSTLEWLSLKEHKQFSEELIYLQRQLMEAYIRQKRASPGMVQASDLQINRPMSGMRSNSRELHAYDGPMQFISSPQNPDQILSNGSPGGIAPATINSSRNHSNNMRSLSTISQEGKWRMHLL